MVKNERQRYILFRIIAENDIQFEQKDFLRSIWGSIWKYFGMKIANKVGLWLLELNLDENYGILRCSHNTKETLITALALIKEINGKKIICSPIKTSGTIKTLKRVKDIIIP